MNREELLEACLGIDPESYRPGNKIIEASFGPDLLCHADIWWRRVLIRPDVRVEGEQVAATSITVPVAAIGNIAVDPGLPEKQLGILMDACHVEAASHALTGFTALFGGLAAWEMFGYLDPTGDTERLQVRFLVRPCDDEIWPPGRIDTRGRW